MVSSFQLVFIVTFVALTEGVIVNFNDCGSKLGKVTSLDFDCNGGTPVPCQFTKGKTYHGKISLTPNTVINNGTIVFHAIIGGSSLPFPFPGKDLCKDHDVVCPLKADVAVVIDVALTVPSFAPVTNLVGKMEIQTSDKEDVMCTEFLVEIVSSENSLTI